MFHPNMLLTYCKLPLAVQLFTHSNIYLVVCSPFIKIACLTVFSINFFHICVEPHLLAYFNAFLEHDIHLFIFPLRFGI